MRRIPLFRPFAGGMVTDIPAYQVGADNSVFAQDGFSPQGVFKQRGGWAYDGTTADVAANLAGVYRAQFILADATRTVTSRTSGVAYIHNPAGAGTALNSSLGVATIPRCVYRDELILCAQDGTTPLGRYSGAPTQTITSTGTFSSTAGLATETGGTFASTPTPGYYFSGIFDGLGDIRIIAVTSTSSVTLEDSVFTTVVNTGGASADAIGRTSNCVVIYNAGTITATTTTVTGTGTKWSGVVAVNDGTLAIPSSGDATIGFVSGSITDTSLGGTFQAVASASAYTITRACPFKDAAAHKNSLWGTGVAQYPNRVYVSPPDWNMAVPPGFELPWDPFGSNTSSNANDFLLDFIDVPAPYDGDHNVAILSSPNPLLVLKRHAVYGISGSFGGVSVDMIADGIGCIDIRSAQSFDEGQFWAGEGGIYWYTAGNVVDLTAGRINREWRALTRDFDYGVSDYCSLGIASGHLIVHITTGAGTTQRTYLCDLRDQSWQSRVSNVTPRYMFSSRLPGEAEKLLAVSDARQGRVLDLAPMLNGSGTAKDDAGTAPRLQAYTTSGFAQAQGIEGLSRLLDLDVHANVYDAGAAGSTQLEVSVVSGGGVGNEADSTKTLDTINSDTVDRIDRHHYRVNRRGRFHQVRFDADTTGTDTAATKVEIHELVGTFRDDRVRS